MLYRVLDLYGTFSYSRPMNDEGEAVDQKKLPSNGEVIELVKGLMRVWKQRLRLVSAGTGFVTAWKKKVLMLNFPLFVYLIETQR